MGFKIFNGSTIENQYNNTKIKYNREYLLSKTVADELNSYKNFEPFATFNDMYEPVYKEVNGKWVIDEDASGKFKSPGALGVRSLFNKSGAVLLGNTDNIYQASEWRVSNNVPLIDTPENRKKIRQSSGCSIKELVQASRDGILGKSTYDYSDFMYCKHLGKMSNNYMITLRRFPLPVDDFISSIGIESRGSNEATSKNSQSIGCMITWLGVSGNEMNNILSYNYSMPFKSQNAEFESNGVDADSTSTPFASFASAFDSKYRKQYMEGQAGAAFNGYLGKFFKAGSNPYNVREIANFEDKNKIYGPVDVIKSTYMRSDEGLKFEQNITLVFEYELRSYNGINGRQAMLDLISNILNVTYTTGTFWGGGYRGGGAHQNNIFSNMNIFKANNGATGFMEAFAKDWGEITSSIKGAWGNNPVQTIKNFMNDLSGMIIAGQLNRLGRPQKQMMNSLLSPAPVGFWHITIGNPHHPIMSMGNMILTDTKVEHMGPLGLDDFPTGLKVTCTLTRGKPRDLRDIEKMYMHGNDRIFYSMGPKIFDMYKNAKEYKGNKNIAINTNDVEMSTDTSAIEISVPEEMKNVLKKYFGHEDTYSIYVAAAEQEYGAHKKPSEKSGPSSGDSRATGTGGLSGNTYTLN